MQVFWSTFGAGANDENPPKQYKLHFFLNLNYNIIMWIALASNIDKKIVSIFGAGTKNEIYHQMNVL